MVGLKGKKGPTTRICLKMGAARETRRNTPGHTQECAPVRQPTRKP